MLPKVEISSFISGIVGALVILALIAYFMNFITSKIAMHNIFRSRNYVQFSNGTIFTNVTLEI